MNEFLIRMQHVIAPLHGWRLILMSIAAAALLTALFVLSGLDWAYFVLVQNMHLFGPLMVADGFGYVFPVVLPAGLILFGRRSPRLLYGAAGVAALIAGGLALAVSSALKVFAGRVSPPHHTFGADLANTDNSAVFQFGFMNETILGGWPSSHAAVAFAVAVTLAAALPGARRLRIFCFIFAALIGIGVTFGFHWLSEFFSGALIGASIGLWVGTAAAARKPQPAS